MKALVLAAGFGTRLAPYTRQLPKALFPVAGVPVLGRMISALQRAGCTHVAVNAHHMADQIRAYLLQTDFKIPVHLSVEAEILGTGGAIRNLAGFWDPEPFLVVNADILTDIDLKRVYSHHCSQKAPVTMVLHDRAPFNRVWVDDCDRVVGFERFSIPPSAPDRRKLAFTGIQVVDTGVISRIPDGQFCDIIAIYDQMVAEGQTIQAYVVRDHYWQDMGTPRSFRDAVVDAMVPEAFRIAFPGTSPTRISLHQLAGDGSDRTWHRLTAGSQRMILADHGITTRLEGSEIRAFVAIGNHLQACGLPVPRIYHHDGFSGLVFLEDLGDCHLSQTVHQTPDDDRKANRYREVIDTLLDLTVKAAPAFDPRWTCQSAAYDRELILEKECRYFVDAFVRGYLELDIGCASLAGEFERLAARTIDNGLAGLIHRDFQSRNIMIRDDRHFCIDFQGARFGPVQYDLAALLIDPYAGLGPLLRQRLLNYATEQATLRLYCDPDRFMEGYRHCTVTRNLQMLGAFGYLSRIKGKTAFERWIPAAAQMLVDHVRSIGCHDFPMLYELAEMIRRICSGSFGRQPDSIPSPSGSRRTSDPQFKP